VQVILTFVRFPGKGHFDLHFQGLFARDQVPGNHTNSARTRSFWITSGHVHPLLPLPTMLSKIPVQLMPGKSEKRPTLTCSIHKLTQSIVRNRDTGKAVGR
jgi:hypothetical protein